MDLNCLIEEDSIDGVKNALVNKGVQLTIEDLLNIGTVLEKKADNCDEVIDRIPYVLVIEGDYVKVRLSLGHWITIDKTTLNRVRDLVTQ